MTKSTITRERLEKIKSWRETYGAGSNVILPAEEAAELASIALAAMNSEPVNSNYRKLFTCTGCGAEGLDEPLETNCHCCVDGAHWVESRLYRHAQPAPEKYNIGDATMRHIFTPTGMTNISDLQAVFDRVEVVLSSMESEHVVTITDAMAYAFHHALTDGPLGDEDVEDIKVGLQAVFSNVTATQPALVVQDGYVMVPREPTAEMQSAGASAIRIETTALNKLWTGNAVFRAMLAAAPQEVKGE
ncbi:TPA: hypothetical protein ACNVPG_003038 [Klebsiella aerogenes]